MYFLELNLVIKSTEQKNSTENKKNVVFLGNTDVTNDISN